MSESESAATESPSRLGAPLRIFINYRRDDTVGWALLLHDRLVAEFGEEHVFLDVRALKPGMRWLEEIKTHGSDCGVFLALVGSRWKSSMPLPGDRAAEDYVRFEIEYAMRRNSGVEVVPVLVGNAMPPTRDGLPSSLQPLMNFQMARLREERFNEDVDELITRMKEIARARTSEDVVRAEPKKAVPDPGAAVPVVAPPGETHFDLVLRHMVDEGNVVPLLGSHLNRAGEASGGGAGPGPPPDAVDLAVALARHAAMADPSTHLAQVAQYVYETQGRADLYRPLTRLCGEASDPGPVHRFFAELPHRFERAGYQPRYQLILSTNFDTALERAFDEANEPYDLAVYMASGDARGKFIHFRYDDISPTTIASPNSYAAFPIDEYGELSRTLIVKIHGAVDGSLGEFQWRENYVITEDHYIDYLSRSPVEGLVPIQILDKLRESHCLFLGYTIRDWSLRVFLKRIWGRRPLGAKSWAIEPEVDILEREFWTHSNVDVFSAAPVDYLDELGARVDVRAPEDSRRP
jgi:hypothetical protein